MPTESDSSDQKKIPPTSGQPQIPGGVKKGGLREFLPGGYKKGGPQQK